MAFITQIFAEGQSLVWLHEMRQLFSSSLTFGETENLPSLHSEYIRTIIQTFQPRAAC